MTLPKFDAVPGDMPVRRSTIPFWKRAWRRAELQIEKGRYAQAVTTLEQARESGADPYVCTLRIADLYRQMDQLSAAFAAAEHAITLDPARTGGWEMILEMAQESGDDNRAVAACNALIKIAPKHIDAYNTLGVTYMQKGDVEAAIRVADTLIRIEPESADHHFRKALLCQHQNEIAIAVYEFTQTIRLDPEGPLSEEAHDGLEKLDMFQLNQIVTLAMEDSVFRRKLVLNNLETVKDRGYSLSIIGEQLLLEFCEDVLPQCPLPAHTTRYQ